jgi:hypothetical protein
MGTAELANDHTAKISVALAQNVIRPACFSHIVDDSRFGFEPTDEQRVLLDRLRWLALRACLRGHDDLEKACFLLAADDESFERFGLLFFSSLRRHARHGLLFHRPGTKSLGRDEVWVLRLLENANDPKMLSRMIAWHVEKKAQRWFRFLASGLARLA